MFKEIIKKKIKNKICSRVLYSNVLKEGIIYIPNKEVGPINFSDKEKRAKTGEFFEFPNMIALNQAVTCLIGNSKKIINIGAGTGTFEWYASVDKKIKLVAQEYDRKCIEWCNKNRKRENIEYTDCKINQLKSKYGIFDLAVAIDVIEHIENYGNFLIQISNLSNRAIFSTPNRDRDYESAVRLGPEYYQHVQEFDAGEFYFLLKAFYSKVELYSQEDPFSSKIKKIGILSTETPLIAYCEK